MLTEEEDTEIQRVIQRIKDCPGTRHAAYSRHLELGLTKARQGTRSKSRPHLSVAARKIYRDYVKTLPMRRRNGSRAMASVAHQLDPAPFHEDPQTRLADTLLRVTAFLRYAARHNVAVWINVFFRSGGHAEMVKEGSEVHAKDVAAQVIKAVGSPKLLPPAHILTSIAQQHGIFAGLLEEGPLQHWIANLVGDMRADFPHLCVLLCFSGYVRDGVCLLVRGERAQP